jgi:cell wall-associated NlpC family hydrolase
MNARPLAFLVALAALIVAIAFHVRMRNAMSTLTAEQSTTTAQAATLEHANVLLQQEIDATRAKLESLRKPASSVAKSKKTPATSAPTKAPASAAADDSPVLVQQAVLADIPDLRQLRVRAYVGERQLMFAGLFHRLGLTPEQLQRFDSIQAEYEQGILDLASSAKTQGITNGTGLGPVRQELADARDTQLREVFGSSYPAWEEASRAQGARVMAGQLIAQTFQSTGPLDNSRTEQLIAIFAHHPGASDEPYDWKAIAKDASGILTGQQLEALQTAISFWQLSDQMNAIASKRR